MALSRRLAAFHAFLRRELPAPPARVLELGCGRGDLAVALADDGYAMTAIDPEAPEGKLFRRVRLEDFDGDAGAFAAVVASVALHHAPDLDAAADRIQELLEPGGLVTLEEFASERFAGDTAGWYYHQRHALAAVGLTEPPAPEGVDAWLSDWVDGHAGIHPFTALHRALDARFSQRLLKWGPYLFDYRLDDAVEPLERHLIDVGAIEATGVRYVGERRASSSGRRATSE